MSCSWSANVRESNANAMPLLCWNFCFLWQILIVPTAAAEGRQRRQQNCNPPPGIGFRSHGDGHMAMAMAITRLARAHGHGARHSRPHPVNYSALSLSPLSCLRTSFPVHVVDCVSWLMRAVRRANRGPIDVELWEFWPCDEFCNWIVFQLLCSWEFVVGDSCFSWSLVVWRFRVWRLWHCGIHQEWLWFCSAWRASWLEFANCEFRGSAADRWPSSLHCWEWPCRVLHCREGVWGLGT